MSEHARTGKPGPEETPRSPLIKNMIPVAEESWEWELHISYDLVNNRLTSLALD